MYFYFVLLDVIWVTILLSLCTRVDVKYGPVIPLPFRHHISCLLLCFPSSGTMWRWHQLPNPSKYQRCYWIARPWCRHSGSTKTMALFTQRRNVLSRKTSIFIKENFAHLQGHETVCYSLWYNTPSMLPATGRQHRGCIIPQAVTNRLVLLKMGEIIARNMFSWLELLINHYCCI